MLLYYITNRLAFTGNHQQQVSRMLAHMHAAARAGVDMIQLREKDLDGRELEELAKAALRECRRGNSSCRLLINSRTDIALAAGIDGVHLRSRDISVADARFIARQTGREEIMIGVSCHTVADIQFAAQADFVVYGPVFGKGTERGNASGLGGLTEACRVSAVPALALGGVSPEMAAECVAAGAAGVAGIRLFQFDSAEEITEDGLQSAMAKRVEVMRRVTRLS